jgi:hypothetical protein
MFRSYKNCHALNPSHPYRNSTCRVAAIFIIFAESAYGLRRFFINQQRLMQCLTPTSVLLQDKKLNILNLASGKPVRCFKPEGDIGEPIKV